MRERKEISVVVARRIRRAREAAGLTQERVARVTGAAPQHDSGAGGGPAGGAPHRRIML